MLYIDTKRQTIQYDPTELNENMIPIEEEQEDIEKMAIRDIEEFIREKLINIIE